MYRDDSLEIASSNYPLANETLALLGKRFSTRNFFVDGPEAIITENERDAIFKAALRAPTAGNMSAYSILDIREQALKEKLSVLCDNQPFVTRAPLALIFVADYQKWTDMFCATRCFRHIESGLVEAPDAQLTPNIGSFMLAVNDAVIAAQNAVIAAESLGIGSCYIGDIMENGPDIAELLNLPQHTFPAAFVVFGRSKKAYQPTAHFCRNMIMLNTYQRAEGDEVAFNIQELNEWVPASRKNEQLATYPEAVFVRKHASEFMANMNDSLRWWLERWCEHE